VIGSLRQRLAIERMSRLPDGSGGALASWTVVATVWGAIQGLQGSEDFAADAVQSEARHRIIVRYRDDIGPADRFRFDDRVFEIVSAADPDGRKRRLVCTCIEKDVA
jgi:SPP1 family predicted phage head-tail adaptor